MWKAFQPKTTCYDIPGGVGPQEGLSCDVVQRAGKGYVLSALGGTAGADGGFRFPDLVEPLIIPVVGLCWSASSLPLMPMCALTQLIPVSRLRACLRRRACLVSVSMPDLGARAR